MLRGPSIESGLVRGVTDGVGIRHGVVVRLEIGAATWIIRAVKSA